MSEKVIEISRLTKRYGSRAPVLKDVSFSIREREFVTIYGKSGSGKTTLLNIIGGLDRPTAGRVVVDGQDIVALPEDDLARMRLAKIGFVFQDFNLLADMTVRGNIELPLRFSGRRNAHRVDELMRKFEIQNIAEETANKISGGEAQRVAVARALMNNPKIVLADEPTGNLDSENTENVIGAFRVAMKEFGTTVLLATHDIDLAGYSSSRITLTNGKTVVETTKTR
jgi:ABC-type lipoprotein export system ATPase subunit